MTDPINDNIIVPGDIVANYDESDPVGEDRYPTGEFKVEEVHLPWLKLEGFTGKHLASRFKKVSADPSASPLSLRQFDKDPGSNPHGINSGDRVQAASGLEGLVQDVYYADETDTMAAYPTGPLPNMAQVSWDDGSEDYDVKLTSIAPAGNAPIPS